ncbi:MAG: FkbM family methyltransferase [Stellaceae bacterium]
MKLFVGTAFSGGRPSGYTTIDIEPANEPDILGDAADLSMIGNETADEFYASHVLEHFAWPRALRVLAEWARVLKVGGVLKVAVPDMEVYARMLMEGQNPWHVVRSIYGAHYLMPGGPQGHHHGYTKRMLLDTLSLLGFDDFNVWNSDYPEAANGWIYAEDGEQLAISVNVSAVKRGAPLLDVERLALESERQPFAPLPKLARALMVDTASAEVRDALLYQKLHFNLIIERNERRRLENERQQLVAELQKLQARVDSAAPSALFGSGQGRFWPRRRKQSVVTQVTDVTREAGSADCGGLGPWNFSGHADQAFGPVTYAQFGEDLILLNIFSKLKIARPSYLDVGAHHPVNCSNTALLYARGSRGVCVEANPNLIKAFTEMRPEDVVLNIGVGSAAGMLDFHMIDALSGRNTFDRATAEAFVKTNPQFSIREVRKIPVLALDEIVARYCNGHWPDLLSVDIEGFDYEVLRASSLSLAKGPKVICVEAISGDDRNRGSELEGLLATRGYAPVGRTCSNVLLGPPDCALARG